MTDSGKNIRAFLAIEPAEYILQVLLGLQEKLMREIKGRISWTKPQGQHVTLKFFGDISMEDVNIICAAIESRIASWAAFNLKVEKLGVFPDVRKPRVLWCGIADDGERISVLQKQLEADFESIGFPREDRSFRAHLTLGRIKESQGLTGVSEALAKHNTFVAGVFSCKELILLQSKLLPQGAVYTKLAEFKLKG